MDSQEQIQDQGETPTTASSEQSGRPVLTRTPKPRPFGGKLRIEIENRSVEPKKELAEEQKQEQNHKEKELSQDGLRLELEEKKSESSMRLEISSPRSGEKPPTGLRLKEQTAAASGTSKPRPFGGKLKIDVEAAELVAPPVIVSPLGYYPSKRLPSNTREDHPASMFSGAESFAGSSFLSRAPPFLEYGMIVSLVCDDRGGLVAAEGFASRDVRLERLNYGVGVSMPNRLGLGGLEERDFFAEGGFRLLTCPFHDCLFEIVPKMTYDATIALKLLVGQSPRLSKKQHTIDNLRFKSEAEGRLNAMMYKKLKGRQVIYGQTIQLRHKKSGKYLSLDSSPMSFRGSEYAPV
ncbi:hypothetical protein PHYBOEH_004742 [Phytophthora boehmeriae]|uniref:MIR domain-containing protein n=1 Tax=Phytophthora boehmeriae TaxID=109152 RepID=A0A8T1X417_9STRA|nr:hypothetical protein PHYBOEH_004742 [Phytophthora boehmeriae]